jgi:hypothetical protein
MTKNIPAFPHSFVRHPTEETYITKGMTLRDYFAGKAMHFCLKNCFTTEGAVQDAYAVADAMMKAREQ